MEITEVLHAADRDRWRAWLAENHASAKEIWLVYYNQSAGKPRLPYLHAVEEALCFGWIDGIQKKFDADRSAQRFTPRRAGSNWSELNKERARRLIAQGRMTEAGRAVLPDLSLEPLQIPADIAAALQADPAAWENLQAFPEVYRRIRIGYIDAARDRPEEFRRRLDNFVKKTRQNKQFGSLE